jgi:hypothetical protein
LTEEAASDGIDGGKRNLDRSIILERNLIQAHPEDLLDGAIERPAGGC